MAVISGSISVVFLPLKRKKKYPCGIITDNQSIILIVFFFITVVSTSLIRTDSYSAILKTVDYEVHSQAYAWTILTIYLWLTTSQVKYRTSNIMRVKGRLADWVHFANADFVSDFWCYMVQVDLNLTSCEFFWVPLGTFNHTGLPSCCV